MPGYTDVFGGQNIFPAQLTLLQLTMTANVTLVWPTEQALPGSNVFADIIEVTPNAGLSLTMPDARLTTQGQATLINNLGANTLTIQDNTGATIGSVASGQVWQFYLNSNSTQAGVWKTFQFGTGASSATAAALAGAGLKAITTTLNVKVLPSLTSTTPTTLVDADRATAKIWNGGVGTFNLPSPATVGTDWFIYIRNAGTGTLTVAASAGLVDGASTKSFRPEDSAIFITDGTNFYTVGYGQLASSFFDHVSISVAGSGTLVLSGTQLDRISYEFTGVLTGNRTIEVPTELQQYWVFNNTSGAFTLTVKTNAGTGVVVPQGSGMILYCDGSNVVAAQGAPTTGVAPIALGGTSLNTMPTTATRYFSNVGGVPSWSQVDLSNGVTNRLPFANLTQGSALSVLGVAGNAPADVASIASASDGQVLRRSGSTVGFGTVDLASGNAVTGVLDEANGGTGQSAVSQGDLLYGSAANVWSRLSKDATNVRYLGNQGTSNNPAWLANQYGLQTPLSASYTLDADDAGVIQYESSGTTTVEIPTNASVAFPLGTVIPLSNGDAASNMTITPLSGVTLYAQGQTITNPSSFVLPAGYNGMLWKVETNVWVLFTDSLVTSGQGVLYAGYCTGSAGASVAITPNTTASSWTVAQQATGRFRVTHSLGLSNAKYLAVVSNVTLSAGGGDDRYSLITNENVNYFEVLINDVGAGAVDDNFYFHATRLA
jgi:hypothetical protein